MTRFARRALGSFLAVLLLYAVVTAGLGFVPHGPLWPALVVGVALVAAAS